MPDHLAAIRTGNPIHTVLKRAGLSKRMSDDLAEEEVEL